MTREELRLALLRLVLPQGLSNPDAAHFIAKARAFEAYVTEAGQASEPPQKTLSMPPQQVRAQPQSSAPARK